MRNTNMGEVAKPKSSSVLKSNQIIRIYLFNFDLQFLFALTYISLESHNEMWTIRLKKSG